jgi:hypothetical protein
MIDNPLGPPLAALTQSTKPDRGHVDILSLLYLFQIRHSFLRL